jgi:hypothetical protein
MLLEFACFFYAPFLFDTLGDSTGSAGAAWVVVLLAILPGAVLLAVRVRAASARVARARTDCEVVNGVEMQEVGMGNKGASFAPEEEGGGTVSAVHALHCCSSAKLCI